jgi:threonylcarbamoyladenosine tRNA methylthiotransferase MtaB
MSEVEIITFGCRLNAYESEVIARAAAAAGLRDAIIVNTCAVTAEAERQARQAIRRARRRRPWARLIVTGCAAEIAPERYRALGEVDAVIGNTAKLKPESYGAAAGLPIPSVEGFVGRVRAYLEVQKGCDHRCTFCVIPLGRGPSRSVPPDALVEKARRLLACGTREITLTGVDLTAYGADLAATMSLGALARRLLQELPDLPRLRLSSLDPAEIDEDLWRLFAEEERLMPHLHLSLQSGDDLVLKRMKRRHSRVEALAVAKRARALRPEVALGADLIAGFPTESEGMFRRSLDLVEEAGLAFLHVFPYSARPGTPASRMPQLAPSLVKERAARLRESGERARRRDFSRRIGSESEVLVERSGLGRAAFYAPIFLPPGGSGGAIRRVLLAGVKGDGLMGALL